MPQIRTLENSLGKKEGSLRTLLDQILDNILQLVFLHLQTLCQSAQTVYFTYELHFRLLLGRNFQRVLRM